MAPPISFQTLQKWSDDCLVGKDKFVHGLPKLELHTHIEGTVSPELRWKLAKRNGIALRSGLTNTEYTTVEQLQDAYIPRHTRVSGEETAPLSNFFNLFDEGVQVLREEEDFYDLATEYFARCAAENVRYVELFFGPHSHRYRNIAPPTFMNGYRRAQREAEKTLGVSCQWIMLLNRQKPLEEAWENYRTVALPYKDMIVGIGIAGNESGRAPSLFDELMAQARKDGFKITVHCDVDAPNTHQHISEVLTSLAGTGADRCDHGLNIAQRSDLIEQTKAKGMGLTLCPWGYCVYDSGHPVWESCRILHAAGVKITINSDDPPYMMGHHTEGNLMLTKVAGGFSNADLLQFERNAVDICWAPEDLKRRMADELLEYEREL